MGSRIPSHQLSNGLYVSGRPDPQHQPPKQPTPLSRAVPYTGGDVTKSGELAKMFDIPPSSSTTTTTTGSFRSGSGPIPKRPPGSGPSSGSGPIVKRPSGSGPNSGSGPIVVRNSGSGLQPTGLLTSGPLGSSVGRRSGQLEPAPVPPKGKTVYGTAVTTLGYDDVRLGFKVSKTLMWMLLVAAVIGLMIGTFLMVAVKKPLILVGVAAVLVLAGAVVLWNFAYQKRRMWSFLRKYPDAELRGALDGQFVKVTGVVTCGSLPLESSFQKVPRCVYVSTELYEYKGWGGKSANPKHHCFSWGCRNSEKYMADFYISDFQSGLRAVVKAGYGAKVAPFVKETTVVDITKDNRESSPTFVSWLADRSLSCDDRVMRLKEGYIKEGSTVSVMGVVRRHDNVLKVWAIADSKRQGYLGFKEFIIAMQLLSLAQAGHELNSNLLKSASDVELLEPPEMEGLDSILLSQKHRGSRNNGVLETNGILAVQHVSPMSLFTTRLSKKTSCHTSLGKVTSIIDGLKRLYNEKLKPLEVAYRYNDFASPLLTTSDFDAKPMVMLLGQYSTGKTTFIKHLLKSNYPGAHIGPEPTTDRFIVVMGGPDERSVPGNTIAVQADMPFNALTTFGGAFLSKFECSQMPHPLLEHITFVDTPGVLSGEKQRTERSYDFTGVIKWFAEKCDLILLLFDPHKLDISDEFKRVISSLRGQDDKIRVVLNKADQVDTQQLMRVYGALMWSLGKVLNTPEVARVYIGSFNDKPIKEESLDSMGKELFEKEQDDLLVDLIDIPKKACDRRINEFVKRARAAKIHAYIISQLKKEMPAVMGKSKAQQKLMKNLEDVFAKIQREFHLPPGDFPDVEHFRQVLGAYNIDKFEKLKPKMIQAVDDMLGYDIPDLLKNFKNPYE